jgi:hypothetical protein
MDVPNKTPTLTLAAMGIAPGRPLNVSAGGIEELRRDIQMLIDIEAIKLVKHAYFRCVDTANFDELADYFHDDVTVHFIGGTYEWKLEGKAAYLAAVRENFHDHCITQHNGHQPEIRMISETEATGIWYLADHVWQFERPFLTIGTALYVDRYLKVDGRWQIRETRYRHLRNRHQARQGAEALRPLSGRLRHTQGGLSRLSRRRRSAPWPRRRGCWPWLRSLVVVFPVEGCYLGNTELARRP